MPKGPKGQKRPANVIGNAVRVMKIATGDEDETLTDDCKDKAAVSLVQRRAGNAPHKSAKVLSQSAGVRLA